MQCAWCHIVPWLGCQYSAGGDHLHCSSACAIRPGAWLRNQLACAGMRRSTCCALRCSRDVQAAEVRDVIYTSVHRCARRPHRTPCNLDPATKRNSSVSLCGAQHHGVWLSLRFLGVFCVCVWLKSESTSRSRCYYTIRYGQRLRERLTSQSCGPPPAATGATAMAAGPCP
jgi:hypothetical protein